jgi:anti-sigma regulatory factor (Ser/Thr protein kinase)
LLVVAVDDNFPIPDLPAAVVGERVRLEVPSSPEWITPTVEYLKQRAVLCGACHETRATKLLLVLHEALTNAIIHGNLELSSDLKEDGDDAFANALAERSLDARYSSRAVIIDIDYDGHRCLWTFTDQGPGFDHERYTQADEPDEAGLWLSSGRGILLMRAFLDGLRYEDGGRRALLTLHRTSGVERRVSSRQSLSQPVRVAPVHPDGLVDWEAAYEAVAQNLSETGAGLLQSQLVRSERILLCLEVEGQPVYVPAQVRHCRALEEGLVELGCCFLPEDVQARAKQVEGVAAAVESLLQQQPARTPPEERRNDPRIPYTSQIQILGPPGTPAVIGFTRDLSHGGIAFVTTVPLPLEPRILILSHPGGESLRLRAQIIRCTAITTHFHDVGARFLGIAE